MQELWEEIRRRNLHRVTAAYAVISWVLAQAAGLLFPAFGLPGWTLRLLIVLLIAALPILWVVLWLSHPIVHRYDTPSGRLHHTEWTLIVLLALVLIASAGEFAFSQFGSRGTGTPAGAASKDASIAVLAFENMSDDPKNEFFSEGISEELLNDLTQVRGLRVAGRTSSFSFKGKNVGIPAIGKALHVRTVLEGSVRRQANRVRITAQLVNAADDYHLWSQTYDREIADIFAVQDELSRAITKELTGRLLGTSQTSKDRVNPKAYTAYLQGRFFMNKRNKSDMLRAIGFFKQAIALEPDYADAHAALAKSYGVMFGNAQSHDDLKPAIEEADTALRLDPENSDALLAKSIIASNQWKWSEADAALRRVLARAPNSADAHNQFANLLADVGLRAPALSQFRRAAELDPLAPIPRANVGITLFQLKRNGEAVESLQAALTLDPNSGFAMAILCRIYSEGGNIGNAQAFQNRLVIADGEEGAYTHQCEGYIAKAKGDGAALKSIAASAAQAYSKGIESALFVGLSYAMAGDNDIAMRWFARSYTDQDHALFKIDTEPDFPPKLAADPRWQKLMQSLRAQELREVRAEIAARGTNY